MPRKPTQRKPTTRTLTVNKGGRPHSSNPKDVLINIRMTVDQVDQVRQLAFKKNTTVSDLIRQNLGIIDTTDTKKRPTDISKEMRLINHITKSQ